MVSSTARDLPLHREQVRLACERAGFEPREMMEHLTALNKDAVEASLRMVAEANVYLGILANRYGTVPTGCDISITEMEYDRAVELEKPRASVGKGSRCADRYCRMPRSRIDKNISLRVRGHSSDFA